jgi:flagellar basal-body rod protein FlgG
MLAHTRKMDVIANNLANVNTHGYKKETAAMGTFPEKLVRRIYDTRSPLNPSARLGPFELSSDVDQNYIYFSRGPTEWTERSLNVVIDDFDNEDGASRARSFFTIQANNPAGGGGPALRYTRDGSFAIGADRLLRTLEGDIVLGEDGPITLEGEDFIVTKNGSVLQGDALVGRLHITSFEDPHALRKVGGNLLAATQEAVERPFDGMLHQGYVEQSNVNVVSEMVDMIACMRAYEANQKMVWGIDGTHDRVRNEVGKA